MTEFANHFLLHLAEGLRLTLETLSVVSVLVGLLATLGQSFRQGRPWQRRSERVLPRRPSVGGRLTFGSWLSMALEFQLGADIVATTISPSRANLIQLAAIALIRTFLNVFLSRELELEARIEREEKEQSA